MLSAAVTSTGHRVYYSTVPRCYLLEMFSKLCLKKKRGTKCLFLSKYIRLALAEGTEDDFVLTETIFQEYSAAVALWTDQDSLKGQTKYLMKKTAFLKVS